MIAYISQGGYYQVYSTPELAGEKDSGVNVGATH